MLRSVSLAKGELFGYRRVIFATRVWEANIISLRPQSCKATRSNITVACNNITLTRSAYHFQFDTAFASTNAVLARKSRRTFGTHKPKAPSGRELPTESGEGERVAIESVQIQSRAGSFHRYRGPPSSRRKAILLPDSTPKRYNTLYLASKECEKEYEQDRPYSFLILRQVKTALWKAPFEAVLFYINSAHRGRRPRRSAS